MPAEWLTWAFWSADPSSVRELVAIITSVLGLIGGAIGIGLIFWRSLSLHRQAKATLQQAKTATDQAKIATDRHYEQTKADQQRRITESFSKAIEQLGSEKLEVRLGAIYALERISKESEADHWPIMEVLTAYVRARSPWPPKEQPAEKDAEAKKSKENTEAPPEKKETGNQPAREPITADLQAILNVLMRRSAEEIKKDESHLRVIDLSSTNLPGALLRGAPFETANFDGSCLVNVNLAGANLASATFESAVVEDTTFCRANISQTNMRKASFKRVCFNHANATDARFNSAIFYKAYPFSSGRPYHWWPVAVVRCDVWWLPEPEG